MYMEKGGSNEDLDAERERKKGKQIYTKREGAMRSSDVREKYIINTPVIDPAVR